MKIATSAYLPEWHPSWSSVEEKLAKWVEAAVAQGADLLVFPEYAGCEAALVGAPNDCAPADWPARMADRAEDWLALHCDLAAQRGVYIVAGSICVRSGDTFVNRSYFIGPSGDAEWQDKLILTPYERDDMQISGGDIIRLFDTKHGRVGILICYDSEFPIWSRTMCEQGADMILVPSATDFPAGQTRVRQSCRARAIENQCLIVQSPVLGPVPDCDILDQGTGRAAIFCPPDHGLPSNGIIAQGETDEAGWIIAEVDPAAICAPRQTGQVGNFSHWIEQDSRANSVIISALA